jgi:MoxR-like ATPase
MDVAAKLALLNQLNTVIVGKPAPGARLRGLPAGGRPPADRGRAGVGKTTLAHALSRTFGLQFSRVQFTADLMPSDLSGVAIYDRGSRPSCSTRPGLRAGAAGRRDQPRQPQDPERAARGHGRKAGHRRRRDPPLPSPFFVIATQNPHDQLGTFALPESQLDRFLMRISLGYPDRAAERELLRAPTAARWWPPARDADAGELHGAAAAVQQVHAAEPLLNYVQDLIAATRSGRWFLQGLSPRAGIAVLRAAKAQALLANRDYVAPDDVQSMLPQTVAHRLIPVSDAGRGAVEQVRAMIAACRCREK